VDAGNFGRKMKGVASWERSKEEQLEKEVSVKPPATEPSRVKIFEGGYVTRTTPSDHETPWRNIKGQEGLVR